jgi:VIT1/CCC1 family predicted Fe2+/Mn2+ transporter
MGEVLFGLIMTLTFTLAAGIVIEDEGRAGAREMLVGILGCNLAWGLIDGVLYVLAQVYERGRRRRLVAGLRTPASAAAARAQVAAELDSILAPATDPDLRTNLQALLAANLQQQDLPPNRITRADLMGGLASGWLVFACSIPAVLPFVFVDDPRLALRVSNALLLLLLFLVGYQSARTTLARPWLAGLVFLLVGVFLVALAIPLGG